MVRTGFGLPFVEGPKTSIVTCKCGFQCAAIGEGAGDTRPARLVQIHTQLSGHLNSKTCLYIENIHAERPDQVEHKQREAKAAMLKPLIGG